MNAEIQSKVDVIVNAFQPVIDAAAAIPALVDAQELVKYNEGVEAGKAMIQLPDPTNPAAQYTQEQMDAAVTAGKEQQRSEDQVTIDAQGTELAALKLSLTDLQAALDKQLADFAAFKERVKTVVADDAALFAEL